ncbi:transcriptional regulator [Bifidobacterium dolichotidis]|uniref:Transcriptional regulator n=1 Tax=Bifidobacterium dolichotidis TaxID=2306976 RepID=A0A430FSP7_9BIFI|nr:GyrI-like domain-containing protein [Bifidobacterium dolichotidis]RSX55914.1 transcriptional regulator [Bifidobacterium dolichotidis]
MAYDFKKECKDLYAPKRKPSIITVPAMQFVTVQGVGDPNEADGTYQQALNVLYAISYTLKMSYKTDYSIDGYFPYVVPPLEGFWWQDGSNGIDYSNKASFQWISAIRLPDFITADNFKWAVDTASEKKQLDCSIAQMQTIDEGLCVQVMHIGSYDDEPTTIAQMDAFIDQQGFANDMTSGRHHHEIYLSDPRRCSPDKLKTIIRHPIIKM